MRTLARLRQALAHHRRWRLALVTGLVLVAGAVASHHGTRLDAARRSWGDAEPTAVAVRAITRGSVIDRDDVALQAWPLALRPPTALDELPIGQVTWQDIGEGEVIVEHDLVPPEGALARLDPGTAAVSVPTGPVPVRLGDDVLVAVDGRPAVRGTVIELHHLDLVGAIALVAVEEPHAPALATAAADGRTTLVLTRPG